MTVDDLTRRAIIAAHDAGCDRQCGEDALTFRRLTSGEQAIVDLWRADWERAERLVAWKDTGFRERDKWQERAETAEAELARLRTATGMADELGARVTDERNEAQAAIERVRAIAFDEDTISALERGVVESGPNQYDGLTKDEALGYAVDALRDIRAALDRTEVSNA